MADWLVLLSCVTIPLLMLAGAFALGYLVGADRMPFRVRFERNRRKTRMGVDDGTPEWSSPRGV